ncbi:MAG: hypothetical protein JW827_05240 [Spirochaetes bacterium]|nr:hypothetical protein [Spirochaetota bacterium]
MMINIAKIIIEKLKYRFLVKIISLLLAVGLWFYVNEQRKPEKYITVPLKLQNIPHETAIASPFKNLILLKVKGNETLIQTLSARDFKATADLNGTSLGKNDVHVKVQYIKGKMKFKIAKVDPHVVEIHLDEMARREVPVSATIINSPAEGYLKTGEKIFPEYITLKGAKSLLETIDVARTKSIDIDGVTGSIYKEVEFDMPNDFVIPVDYKTAKVNIKIVKNYKAQVFKEIKIDVIKLQDNLKVKNIDDLVGEIKVYGPPARLKMLENENKFLYIDALDIKNEGRFDKPVQAKLPLRCTAVYINPSKIDIEIEEK